MSKILIKTCNRCGKTPINQEYTLSISAYEVLPDGGGICHGMELSETFDYCNKCKKEILTNILSMLRQTVNE